MEILRGPSHWPSILLARAGRYDPDGPFEEAQRAGAWAAWRRATSTMNPQSVIRVVGESGLRGRGGAGFPTGRKWRACASQPSERRYVVANGYEADPGAQLDRTLMEIDPHAVVEGAALAAYAVGAREAIIAVKADYTVAIRRLTAAVAGAQEAGYLGESSSSGDPLRIEIQPLQGAFMLGEETALLRSLEGRPPLPDQRPPFPAVRGLHGAPTVVNNVETLAAVPTIIEGGAPSFASCGLPASPGTTLFQIVGAVASPGVVEAPFGVSLGELLDIAGGVPRGQALKALQIGGPAGGFLGPDALETELTFERLEELGGLLGSGTILVADESACIVDLAGLLTRYLSDEACGKTVPCRIGTRRLWEISDRFITGNPRPSDPELLEQLAADVRDGALCALERTASNPLLTGMRYFAAEFEDHIVRSTCAAGVCRPLRVAVPAH